MAGAYPQDSGKTSLALALIGSLRASGVKAGGFKPLAGHSLWWQYESYLKSLRRGSLFGMDAYRLWMASGRVTPIEVVNPADVLLSVPILSEARAQRIAYSPLSYELFVLGRFTICRDGLKHIIYYRGRGLPRLLGAEELFKKLSGRAERLFEVSSLEEYLKLHSRYYLEAVNSCFEVLRGRVEEVVVESFNDSVYPWPGVEEARVVAVSAPPEVLIYEPEMFFNALKVLGDPYTKVYSDIHGVIKPIDKARVKPLPTSMLRTMRGLMEAYDEAVRKILEFIQ